MKINQLFRRVVDVEVLHELCRCLGLDGADDGRYFTRGELKARAAADRVKAMPMYQQIKDAYIPCKRLLYIDTFEQASEATASGRCEELRLLVILRQLLRVHGRRLATSEHNCQTRIKYIKYRICGADSGGSGLQVRSGAFRLAMS